MWRRPRDWREAPRACAERAPCAPRPVPSRRRGPFIPARPPAARTAPCAGRSPHSGGSSRALGGRLLDVDGGEGSGAAGRGGDPPTADEIHRRIDKNGDSSLKAMRAERCAEMHYARWLTSGQRGVRGRAGCDCQTADYKEVPNIRRRSCNAARTRDFCWDLNLTLPDLITYTAHRYLLCGEITFFYSNFFRLI